VCFCDLRRNVGERIAAPTIGRGGGGIDLYEY